MRPAGDDERRRAFDAHRTTQHDIDDAVTAPGRDQRHEYVTSSRHELDPRPLVLRGGRLDGSTRLLVAAVGQRVFCGDAAWSADDVYVATADASARDGAEHLVCIPAFAAPP